MLSVIKRIKSWFSFSLSLHPAVKAGEEKEKDCVQTKCKGSVKMKQSHFPWLLQ